MILPFRHLSIAQRRTGLRSHTSRSNEGPRRHRLHIASPATRDKEILFHICEQYYSILNGFSKRMAEESCREADGRLPHGSAHGTTGELMVVEDGAGEIPRRKRAIAGYEPYRLPSREGGPSAHRVSPISLRPRTIRKRLYRRCARTSGRRLSTSPTRRIPRRFRTSSGLLRKGREWPCCRDRRPGQTG